MGAVRQYSEFKETFEWVLKAEVEDDSSEHDADTVADSQLQYLVELHEQAVGKLTVNQLHHEWGN